MLTVTHLSKRFGNLKAVNDVSFHVEKGSTFAFLGTNGAGKSTVIHMLINLLKPDKGTITFTGGVLEEVTGVVFQNHRLDEALTLEENLMIRARLYGINKKEAKKHIDDLFELTNLTKQRGRMYGKCSGGEKRKTDIIRALLHHPRFLILDEPTTGLDAESREEIWAFLKKLQQEQELTIFLTTHYIEEVEDVDYVLIMHEGKVQVEGTPLELKTQYSQTILKLYATNKKQLIDILSTYPYPFESERNRIAIVINESKDAIAILQDTKDYIFDFSLEKSSLENVFLQVSKQVKGRVKI